MPGPQQPRNAFCALLWQIYIRTQFHKSTSAGCLQRGTEHITHQPLVTCSVYLNVQRVMCNMWCASYLCTIYMSPAFLYLQHLAHESHVRSRHNTPPTSNFLSLATFWLGLLVGRHRHRKLSIESLNLNLWLHVWRLWLMDCCEVQSTR